jgi:hypothetical protein
VGDDAIMPTSCRQNPEIFVLDLGGIERWTLLEVRGP